MIKTFVQSLLIALSGFVAIQTNKYLIGVNFTPQMSIICSAGAAVLVKHFLSCLYVEINRWEFIRKVIDPISNFEGHWLIKLDEHPDRPYSYACIEYNTDSRNYTYKGAGFKADGTLGSHWEDIDLSFDLKTRKLTFLAEAYLADAASEIIKNWGYIVFEKEAFGREYTRGKGFFVDLGTKLKQTHFYLDRLYKRDLFDLAQLKTIKTHDDMAKIICEYHARRTKKQ